MATSPNYGWSEPDNTSLVKDGAQAMRTLGDSIDTSVWNVGFGQAGKNKIINGDFAINQRAFTSTTTNNTFMFDRFRARTGTGTSTFTAQTFAVGGSPSPYEFKNYLQIDVTGQSGSTAFSLVETPIEGVKTLAGQTATISFWAKASSGTPYIAAQLDQIPVDSVDVNITGQKVQISTTWTRYSVTINIPALVGATGSAGNRLVLRLWVSAGSSFDVRTQTLGIQTGTFQIAGIQLEAGSKATPFQTASGGSIQGELAMCQRYYYRVGVPTSNAYENFGLGTARSTTAGDAIVQFPVTMRDFPASIDYANIAYYAGNIGASSLALSPSNSLVLASANRSKTSAIVYGTVASGFTANQAIYLTAANSTSSYLGFSAEL